MSVGSFKLILVQKSNESGCARSIKAFICGIVLAVASYTWYLLIRSN